MKGFLDVVTKGDLWDWLEQLFIKGYCSPPRFVNLIFLKYLRRHSLI